MSTPVASARVWASLTASAKTEVSGFSGAVALGPGRISLGDSHCRHVPRDTRVARNAGGAAMASTPLGSSKPRTRWWKPAERKSSFGV